MGKSESLDQHQTAYQERFKFFDENEVFLDHYGTRVCQVIREKGLQSVLSLGIGQEVVGDKILREFDHSLERYSILEGSPAIIDSFKKRTNLDGKTVSVIHTYFEDFETEERYDGIEVGFVLEHVLDPGAILKKYKGLLKPDGVMFVSVPNARSLHRLIGHEAGLLDSVYTLSDHDLELGHRRYFDLQSITKLIEDAGLTVTRQQGLFLKPITQGQMAALKWDKNIMRALLKVGDKYPELSNCILIEATH